MTTLWRTIPSAQEWAEISPSISNVPYWLRDGNPFADHPWTVDPNAKLPAQVDVAVIGAGFGGASLAYHWSRKGNGTMVVLEKEYPASGAAGRNGGFVAPAGWYPGYYVYRPLEREIRRVRSDLSSTAQIRLVEEMTEAYVAALAGSEEMILQTVQQEQIDCDYARDGWVFTTDAIGQPQLTISLDLAQTRGWKGYVPLDPREIKSRTGIVTDFAGSVMQGAGTWHPARWVWSLFDIALKDQSVELYTKTPAVNVERNGDGYIVRTPRGEISAKQVVCAAEAYSGLVFENFFASYRSFIRPHRSQGAYAEGRPSSMLLGPGSSGPYTWFHPRRNGFAFGADTSPIPLREVELNNPSRLLTFSAVAEALRLWGPQSLTIQNEWTGSVALSPDNYPVIGSLDGKGAWICGAYAGAGSTCSFRGALHIVNRLLGSDEDADVFPEEFFSPARFHRHHRYGEVVPPRAHA